VVTFDYTDPENREATSCELSNLSGVTETQACACASGVCTVGVTSDSMHYGASSFEYKVLVGGTESNTATASFDITSEFVSVWETTTPNETITLPLLTGHTYNFVVDWGDGETSEITAFDDLDIDHVYATAGTYTMTMVGTIEAWNFIDAPDISSATKIIEVVDLGAMGWRNLSGAFSSDGLISFYGSDTTGVTNMSNMFIYASSLVTADVSDFNTSGVTNMANMFQGTALVSLDLSNFDTSSVENMYGMLAVNSNLESVDVSSFDTSLVTDMYGMFYAFAGTDLDLSNFNVDLVTDMGDMFNSTGNLATLDVTGWDVSHTPGAAGIFSSTGAGLVVTCDQGGTPGTGTFYGYSCN